MRAGRDRSSPWWARLLPYARPQWIGLCGILSMMLLQTGAAALQPWPLKMILDHVFTGLPFPDVVVRLSAAAGFDGLQARSPTVLLAYFAGVSVVLFIVRQGLKVAQNYVTSGVGMEMVANLRADVFDHLQRLSLRYHARHPLGDLLQRVAGDTSCVRALILNVVISRVGTLMTLVTTVAIIWSMNPRLAWVVVATGLPLGFISRYFNRSLTERKAVEQRLAGEMTSLAEETLGVLPLVQGLGREDRAEARFGDLSEQSIRAALHSILVEQKFSFSTGSVRAVSAAAVLLVGGLQVADGALTVGGLLVVISYMNMLFGPLEGLAYATVAYAGASASAARVFEILDEDDRITESPRPRAIPGGRSAAATVRFEEVVFGYEPDQPVLRGLTFEISPGEVVALVGPSGAGKSTIARLLPRLIDPWSGRVLLGGMDIREARLADLRDRVGMVLQDPFILPVTISENIAYGRPTATAEEIRRAARAASADTFIEALPNGYATVVGEAGATLSGGERQRISIARAFLRDPPILILDEPTSALDGASEAVVLKALDELTVGRTVLMIAHRFSTIRKAHRILVVEDGSLVQAGTHEALLRVDGAYGRAWRLQESPAAGVGAGERK